MIRIFLIIPNLSLQVFDLRDGASHGDFKRLDGAFKTLEKIDLHHSDKEPFAVFLGEGVVATSLIEMLVFGFQVTGWRKEGEFVTVDLVIKPVVGKEAPLQIDLGVNGNGLQAIREAAESRDAAFVVAQNMFPRTGDGQLIQKLEKARAEFVE